MQNLVPTLASVRHTLSIVFCSKLRKVTVKVRIVSQCGNPLVAIMEEVKWAAKKLIAIYTYYDEDNKKVMWEGAVAFRQSDREWATNYTFAGCRCLNILDW